LPTNSIARCPPLRATADRPAPHEVGRRPVVRVAGLLQVLLEPLQIAFGVKRDMNWMALTRAG
jgi:hypothetical protein